jgi:MerR family transcriptional regulator, thiopeptide resistance regulator
VTYRVGDVSRMAGVTIRTLHHYDEIGLLSPAVRGTSGRREYGEAELTRLQQILFYRELGFALDEIAALLDGGGDALSHLRRQRDLLADRIERLQVMSRGVEEALQAVVTGLTLTPEERFAVFGHRRAPAGYADEAERRWGGTAQWTQARERAARYTAADLQRMQDETNEWVTRLLGLVEAGFSAESEAAADLAEEHRLAVQRWWFDCDHALHRELGELLVTEPEQLAFLVPPERQVPGLGVYIRDAVAANARRAGA